MKYKVSKEIARFNPYEIRKWIWNLSISENEKKETIFWKVIHPFDKEECIKYLEIANDYTDSLGRNLERIKRKTYYYDNGQPVLDKDKSLFLEELRDDYKVEKIVGLRYDKDDDFFSAVNAVVNGAKWLKLKWKKGEETKFLDFATSDKECLEKILLDNNQIIIEKNKRYDFDNAYLIDDFQRLKNEEFNYGGKSFDLLKKLEPLYRLEIFDSLLKLEIGRMSDEEVKVYAESRESLFEKYRSIGSIDFILNHLGEKSLFNRVASDLATSVDLDYQRRDDVDLIKASVDRLEKQENGNKKIRKWIDRFSHFFDYNYSEAEWSEINERIQEKVEKIKVLEKKIIGLESEKQKPKLLDELYEEFDEARENLAQIYGINDPDNLSDLVDSIENGAKWVLIKEEKGQHKFVDFSVSDKQTLEKILKENNIDGDQGLEQHWVFEVYEPSSNLNLVGKMLVDNAELLNNYKTDNDIEDFVSFVICGKISQFEAEQFGIFEKEKEVQKETKTKTLKMKI